MTLGHTNFFAPYESVSASHENQLTRALLVVLRYSPMAHESWLRLVAPERRLHALPKPEFATQRQRVLANDVELPEGEGVTGVSVWLAPDARPITTSVEPSSRQQILDGIITYGSELVVVVENKIGWGGVTEQPHKINLHGSAVVFEPNPRAVRWQDLLGVFVDLVDRDLVSGAERLILEDFFDVVEAHFPQIGPFSTLSRCGDQRFRLERRLDFIQEEVLQVDTGKGLGWRDIKNTPKIAMAWLGLAEDNSAVRLCMYPGDTLGQARHLYGDASSVGALIALRSEGWRVEPNFHWGFTAGGYAWTKTPVSVDEYCRYWIDRIAGTHELGRSEWEPYWTRLQADRIVEPSGKEAFDAEFTRSHRQKANPRPGLFCEYVWPLADAKRLDTQGRFVPAVRERVNQVLSALRVPNAGSV